MDFSLLATKRGSLATLVRLQAVEGGLQATRVHLLAAESWLLAAGDTFHNDEPILAMRSLSIYLRGSLKYCLREILSKKTN